MHPGAHFKARGLCLEVAFAPLLSPARFFRLGQSLPGGYLPASPPSLFYWPCISKFHFFEFLRQECLKQMENPMARWRWAFLFSCCGPLAPQVFRGAIA